MLTFKLKCKLSKLQYYRNSPLTLTEHIECDPTRKSFLPKFIFSTFTWKLVKNDSLPVSLLLKTIKYLFQL